MLNLEIHAEVAPIRIDDNGIARIGDTRVTLDTIVAAFHLGDSPEQIVDSYDVLSLADVYAVIAYYLKHRPSVDTYLQEQSQASRQVFKDIERQQPQMFTLRQRLLEQRL